VDWLNSKLRVERDIVCQQVDDVKSEESRKQLTIDRELLNGLGLSTAESISPLPAVVHYGLALTNFHAVSRAAGPS
jgi:hypothetical protein